MTKPKLKKPKKLYNVGQELHYVSWNDEDGKCELKLYIIRSIRKGTIHATLKWEHTWVKLSTKAGDYGWAKYISRWEKERFREDGKYPAKISLTKLDAWKKAKQEVEDYSYFDDVENGEAMKAKLLRTITTQITKHNPKKKVKP